MEYQSNRLCILTKIRNIIGNNSAEGKVEQALLASKRNPQQDALIFCAEDGESITREFWQTEYRHAGHSHTRAFVFDAKIKWEFRDDGELRHFAVGAILWRQEKDARRYCLFRRRTHPIGCFTIPAGHLEMGESPKAAAQREAFEETQMSILSIELFYEGEINEECRRGADYHDWHLYLCECAGEPRLCDEGDVIGWFAREEIINELKLTKPTGIFFERLFGEKPKQIREM